MYERGRRNTWNHLLGLYETYYMIEDFWRVTSIERFIDHKKVTLKPHCYTPIAIKHRLKFQQTRKI